MQNLSFNLVCHLLQHENRGLPLRLSLCLPRPLAGTFAFAGILSHAHVSNGTGGNPTPAQASSTQWPREARKYHDACAWSLVRFGIGVCVCVCVCTYSSSSSSTLGWSLAAAKEEIKVELRVARATARRHPPRPTVHQPRDTTVSWVGKKGAGFLRMNVYCWRTWYKAVCAHGKGRTCAKGHHQSRLVCSSQATSH